MIQSQVNGQVFQVTGGGLVGGGGGFVPPVGGFYYLPYTAVVSWNDSGGGHSGDLENFYAVADISTVSGIDLGSAGITEIGNLNYLTALTSAILNDNSLTAVDLTGCGLLEVLNVRDNPITGTLDVNANCPNLLTLNAAGTDITSLDTSSLLGVDFVSVSGCTSLLLVDFSGSSLAGGLFIGGCSALVSFTANGTNATTYNLSGLPSLITASASGCGVLTTLDVTGCTALTILDCNTNALTALNITGCTALATLVCFSNALTTLDVSTCTALAYLDCNTNALTGAGALNVTGCTALDNLYCFSNALTTLDVSTCTALTVLDCNANALTALNITGCTALAYLACVVNALTTLDVSTCTVLAYLECFSNALTTLDVSTCTALAYLDCNTNALTGVGLSSIFIAIDASDPPAGNSGSIDVTNQTTGDGIAALTAPGLAAYTDLNGGTWSWTIYIDP